MLPFFSDPYSDELLYSAFARYHFYSGNIDLKDTLVELFGKNSVVPSFEIGSHLQFLCDALGGEYRPWRLIQEHTLFPFYVPFLPTTRQKEIVIDIITGDGKGVYTKIGIVAGSICRKEDIYYCSSCAIADIESLGETYIHREHQLQGVILCPRHGQVLKKYPTKKSGNGRLEYVRFKEELLDLSDISLWQEAYQDKLLGISKAAYYLLSHDLGHIGKDDILLRYKNLLYEMDLTTNNLRIKQEELHEMVVNHYGNELLNILESRIDKNDEYNWLRAATRGIARTVHPLRHILLILFLTGDMDRFFAGMQESYNPFGKEPWPCLNKVADHYQQDIVTQLIVTADYKTRKPVGTFICNCGYVYSRTGPDKSKKDRYCKGRVKAFGHIWENRLKVVLGERCLSYRKMAFQMGCDIKTIYKFEAMFAEKKVIGIDDNQANQKAPESLLTNEYKERLLCIVKGNPDLSRTEIRAICQKEYSFLYRHNKKWLFDVLPTGKKQNGSKGYVDWDKRDYEILLQLREVHNELLNREKTIRISKTSLGTANAKLSLLEKHLDMLPQCEAFITKVSETKEQFQLRRCQNIVAKMQDESLPLIDWKIQRQAGLRKGDYELIKERFALLLHEINEVSQYGETDSNYGHFN